MFVNKRNLYGKKITYTFGGATFSTKKAVKDKCRELLYKYNIGAVITDTVEHSFLTDLVNQHPYKDFKIGAGIKYFFIAVSEYKNRMFKILRIDNTDTDFSFIQCIDGERTKKVKFRKACRDTVKNQILNFKDNAGYAYDKTVDVDHTEIEFEEMVRQFIDKFKIDVEQIEFDDARDNQTNVEFVDKLLKAEFQLFHYQKARLQILTKQAHSAKQHKKYD